MGFYFAWLIHYTGMLLIPSVVGIVIFLIQLVQNVIREEEKIESF